MPNDWELLHTFAREKDQQGGGAFSELVGRHIDMVYGVAKRMLGTSRADDAVQAVFLLLSQRADRISPKGSLAGWLFRATRYCCANIKKSEDRRRRHERSSAMKQNEHVATNEELTAVLDEALERLNEKQRQAILVRYLENRSVAETSEALGVSISVVERRLRHGLEKIRSVFARKGFVVPAAAVGAVMMAESAKAAPVGLVASAAGVTTTASASVVGIAKGALTMMKMAITKTIAAAAVTTGIVATIVTVSLLPMAHGEPQAASTSPATAVDPDAEDAYLTKKDLLAGVEALRSEISDLTVSYSFNAIKPIDNPNYWGVLTHQVAVVKGDKTYQDYQYGPAAQFGIKFRKQTTYNGTRSASYTFNTTGMAGIRTKRDDETRTQGWAFFDFMLLNDLHSQNLASILRSGSSSLRAKLENIDGRRCHVVDVVSPGRRMTIWIDADRGFLPIRHTYLSDRMGAVMQFDIQDAVEVAKGHWMVVRGTKKSRSVEPKDPNLWEYESILEVDGLAAGTPEIRINSGVADEFFDLWNRLPPGTLVSDMDAQKTWRVGGTDLNQLKSAAEPATQNAEVQVPERSSPERNSVAPAR